MVMGRIGEGAFGEVSLANSPVFGQVAVKWLKPSKVHLWIRSLNRSCQSLSIGSHPTKLAQAGGPTPGADHLSHEHLRSNWSGARSHFGARRRCWPA